MGYPHFVFDLRHEGSPHIQLLARFRRAHRWFYFHSWFHVVYKSSPRARTIRKATYKIVLQRWSSCIAFFASSVMSGADLGTGRHLLAVAH